MQQIGINIALSLDDLDRENCSGARIKFRSADQSYLLMAGYPGENPEKHPAHPEDRVLSPYMTGEYESSPVFQNSETALSAILSTVTDQDTSVCNIGSSLHEIKLNFKSPEAISDLGNAEEIALELLHKQLAVAKTLRLILVEPLISAGRFFPGKTFFSEFERQVRRSGALLIVDERRTGLGLTGKTWAFEHFALNPDVILFGNDRAGVQYLSKIKDTPGEKTREVSKQLPGILRHLDDRILDSVRIKGVYLLKNLQWLERQFPAYVTCARGLGLFAGFNLPSDTERKEVLEQSAKNGLILEFDGERSILLRPALDVTTPQLEQATELLNRAILDTLR